MTVDCIHCIKGVKKSMGMGHAQSSKKSLEDDQYPEASTQYGRIRGKYYKIGGRRSTRVFLGIPYAKPPIGELRFKKPVPPTPWNDEIRLCQKYGYRSIQRDFIWDQLELRVRKSEDCLTLNVMAPNWDPPAGQSNFPVIVYVHGGGFVMDSAVKYHYSKISRNIVSKDVIFVTIQYRLGYLGFLTTDDENAPGNNGIWDQYTALKFVKDNIANFGGDPENITLMGQSAGGVSCDLLSLSPYSRDLFTKVILLAGNAETIWSVSPRCRVARNCREKAIELGFVKPSEGPHWSFDDNAAMVEYLKSVPADKLGTTMVGSTAIFESIQLPVTPVIDGDFFPKPLGELREEAPVKTVIAGECEFEGMLFLALGLRMADKKLLKFVKSRASSLILEGNRLVGPSNMTTLETWEGLYGLSEEEKPSKKMVQNAVVTMMGDIVNGIPLYNLKKNLVAKGSTVYAYNFTHFNVQALQGIGLYLPFYGATHGSELNSIFDTNLFVVPYVRTSKDRKVTDLITTLFTNFAKYADPNGPLNPSICEDGNTTTTDESDTSSNGETSPSLPSGFHWAPITANNLERELVIQAFPYMREKIEHERFAPQTAHYEAIHHFITTADEETYNDVSSRAKDSNISSILT
uniref:Carboxylic ester hydrolase n=1 Tax=Panagrellus redivivus TaxID=6233 RepID=A0A7E4V6W0_PANRE